MLRIPIARVLPLLGVLGALPLHASAGNEAGASTFDSARTLYQVRTLRDEDIEVPKPKPALRAPEASLPGPSDSEPAFEIRDFQISGNTLLSTDEVRDTLTPFRGAGRRLSDVKDARDALQKGYETAGFLSVAVSIPQQTIEGGVVRLDVLEARLGNVSVQNEGVKWFDDESVLHRTPRLQPGALLTRADLESDLQAANTHPDRRVRPVLRAGAEPGTVDLTLDVDDELPLHGSLSLDNAKTPGSPTYRTTATVSYANLWGLEHEVSASYQFPPFNGFRDLQVLSGTYRAPMPWSDGQSLLYYIAYSSTENGIVTAPGLQAIGNGFTQGLRYSIALPRVELPSWLEQSFTLGADYKRVRNTVSATGASITTPINYLPFNVEYTASGVGPHAYGMLSVGLAWNFAGMVHGGSKEDFQANRGGVSGDNPVTGNYRIVSFSLDHVLRVPSLLQTLAAGRFIELPEPSGQLSDDWTIAARSRGQFANQPLIATEQFSVGGVDSVRGYLEGERFGDNGWDGQLELRAPAFREFLGVPWNEYLQLVAFCDGAEVFIKNASEGEERRQTLQGCGVGLRAGLLERITAEFFVAHPRYRTENYDDTVRYYIQLAAGF